MTTSDRAGGTGEAYVWVWLPDATSPVVAGRLERSRGTNVIGFRYGRSYLERDDAIALYEPELPLRPGVIEPLPGLNIASSIRDAGPDAWGQRVILARHMGHLSSSSDTADLDQLTYLLESGTNRIGGLDFQASSTEYVPRADTAPLTDLQRAAEALENGEGLPDDLATALLRGTSIGGARPKVLVEDAGRHLVAKLSSTTDRYPVVKAEAVAMALARRVGLDVPNTSVINSMGKDVLIVERFDRTAVLGQRRLMVSALTMLGLDEMMARYATYADMADLIRARFTSPNDTLRELFTRIVFNVCIGNTDDHARNHAAFWDGRMLTLTPAYDLCPQLRSGGEAAQAMAIDHDGSRTSQLRVCLNAAPVYHLDRADARAIIEATVAVIRAQWKDASEEAHLAVGERTRLWGRQVLNQFVFEGLPPS